MLCVLGSDTRRAFVRHASSSGLRSCRRAPVTHAQGAQRATAAKAKHQAALSRVIEEKLFGCEPWKSTLKPTAEPFFATHLRQKGVR